MRPALALLALALAACEPHAPEPAALPRPTAPPPANTLPPADPPPPAPPTAPEPPPAPPAEPPLTGVGPGGAEGREARRQAVLDLLSDGHSAAALELVASDRGRKFNPYLDDELTPTIRIERNTIPVVRQRPHTVKGPLDKDIVRRITRAHINEIRYCYNQGLARDPRLGGTVTIDFTILATGTVGESKVASSTLRDAAVGECMAKAPLRWSFPKPDPAATVAVSYPFELAPPD
jgi:hypothetical protein